MKGNVFATQCILEQETSYNMYEAQVAGITGGLRGRAGFDHWSRHGPWRRFADARRVVAVLPHGPRHGIRPVSWRLGGTGNICGVPTVHPIAPTGSTTEANIIVQIPVGVWPDGRRLRMVASGGRQLAKMTAECGG